MLPETKISLIEERFKQGEPVKTLTFRYNGFKITGVAGSEIRVRLIDLQDGSYKLVIDQIGVPQLEATEFPLSQPAITFENGEMRLRDELENLATFTPITD
jgi:hypothetical protein